MATIQFDSEIHPVRSNGGLGGVYSIRNISRASNVAEKKDAKETEVEDIEGHKSNLHQDGDIRKAQVFRGWVLFWYADLPHGQLRI